MSAAVIIAIFAGALNPQDAWADHAAWREVPAVALSGVDGADVRASSLRARWNDEWIFFEFTCRDAEIVSPGTRDGIDHFKLGDVVEIFLGRAGAKTYAEVHATPEGRKSLYFFSDYRTAAAAPAGAESAQVRAATSPGGWRAVMSIPWSMAGGSPRRGAWEILAGRYDYAAPGAQPVLSSFPAQVGKPDFHVRARYAKLDLQR
mgnify:CR=1 FL=1